MRELGLPAARWWRLVMRTSNNDMTGSAGTAHDRQRVRHERRGSSSPNDGTPQKEVGFVAIGRNEGERLKRCLRSILRQSENVVYVDSGSGDGSVEFARSVGVDVVCLDQSIPFSAARARNAGFEHLTTGRDGVGFVQFIDGDCELVDDWICVALGFLAENPGYAVVAGRRREREPDLTVYNRLCDIEWNTPVGDTTAVGGDFLVRSRAFTEVDGFNPVVVAGEEPDLCHRLSKRGWKIRRVAADMTVHDARMTRFRQWWKRASRAGHAYIHGYFLHRADREGYYRRQTVNCWLWAVGLPLGVVAGLSTLGSIALLFLLAYPVQVARIAVRERVRCGGIGNGLIYGTFTVLAKWPHLMGELRFLKRRLLRSGMTIMEHR